AAPMSFAIELADHGVRMPQSLFIDSVDRLGTETCPVDSGVGIGVFPALDAVAPQRGGPDATGTIQVVWPGPVVGRVEVTWSTTYDCSGGSQQANGTSRFTIFPNGRVVRYDVATPSTTMLVQDGGSCGCGGQSNYGFSTFWAFAKGLLVG